MSSFSRIILECLGTEITPAESSNLETEISRRGANLAFPITSAQWIWLLVSGFNYKRRYVTDAYPCRDASEKRCNCVSLTSKNSLGLKQRSTLTFSSLGRLSSQPFHWVFWVSSTKSSHPSLFLLRICDNSLAFMIYAWRNEYQRIEGKIYGWHYSSPRASQVADSQLAESPSKAPKQTCLLQCFIWDQASFQSAVSLGLNSQLINNDDNNDITI